MVSDQAGDERKMLDEIAHKLKHHASTLDIHIAAVAHTKRTSGKSLEEGAQVHLSDLRGSENDTERNTTIVRVVKNRFCGRTGPATKLLYDENTGRMNETMENDNEEE